MGGAPSGATPEPREIPAHLSQIGKYRVVGLLGRGGMGAVYQATDANLERDVALKVMLPHFADVPENRLRFEREARAAARMMHPNVVTVFDLGYHTDGSPYIVMELLKGRDLFHLLREQPDLGLRRKVALVVQVLDGLAQAHRAGIVHRDIKPGNVFIVESGDAKIMDFGIARISDTAATGRIVGTAKYMSPEQVMGLPIDGRSDLFGVGCMLAELASGRSPFESDSAMNTLHCIAHQEPVLALPEGPDKDLLEPVLVRALAKRPADRIASAVEFASALRELLADPDFGMGMRSWPGVMSSQDAAPTRNVLPRAPRPVVQPGPAAVSAVAPDPAPLFRLLREIHAGRRSGHLHLTSGHERRLLRVLSGQIIDGSSDVDGERLGDVLVRYGLLSQGQLEQAVAVVLRNRTKLGRVLGETGLLDRPRLEEAIGVHIREMLFAMVDRVAASFHFEELAVSLLDVDVTSQLSTAQLILEATRRVQDPDLVRRVIGNPRRPLAHSEEHVLRAQAIALTPVDGFVLSRIDGTLSARQVLDLIPLPAEEVERSLFGLLCTGLIQPVEMRGATRPDRDCQPEAPVSGGVAPSAVPAVPRVEGGAPSPAGQTTAGSMAAAAAKPSEPKRTVSSPPPQPVSAQPRSCPSPSERRSDGSNEVRRIILETHAKLAHGTHYEVLGIEPNASDVEVRQASHRLIRLLHPDACGGPEFEDVQPQRAQAFVRVGQAFEVLHHLQMRAAYDKYLRFTRPDGGPTVRPPAPPAIAEEPSAAATNGSADGEVPPQLGPALAALATAEAHLKDARYWDAIQAVEPLVPTMDGAVRARARFVLARAYAKNPKWQRRAEQALKLAIEDDPRHVQAHALLAEIYAVAGLKALARGMYRKVLALDPHNALARARLDESDSLGSERD